MKYEKYHTKHPITQLKSRWKRTENEGMRTSCSVMLISSSCCRNCSNIYLGAMSTRDCKETFQSFKLSFTTFIFHSFVSNIGSDSTVLYLFG